MVVGDAARRPAAVLPKAGGDVASGWRRCYQRSAVMLRAAGAVATSMVDAGEVSPEPTVVGGGYRW